MPRLLDAAPWQGREDGPGPEHARFHHRLDAAGRGPVVGLLGFACDEGVRRNGGRPGAAEGPGALRRALASMAVHTDFTVHDAGDVEADADLEAGQALLGEELARLRAVAGLTVVLGGGHETAFGSYLGLRPELDAGLRLGVLNLDAHFDLRAADRSTSGTPFRQMADAEAAAGRALTYAALGIAPSANTRALFQTAGRLGAPYLLDVDCQDAAAPREFVEAFLAGVDAVYLTIDLDVLPQAQAPGVSAPASVGVPLAVADAVCAQVAASGKLTHLDVVELNPGLDRDAATARAGARLIHTAISAAT